MLAYCVVITWEHLLGRKSSNYEASEQLPPSLEKTMLDNSLCPTPWMILVRGHSDIQAVLQPEPPGLPRHERPRDEPEQVWVGPGCMHLFPAGALC